MSRAHRVRALLALSSVATSSVMVAPAAAQQLPGYSGPSSVASAEWTQSIRIRAEGGMQDWINLMDRRAWADLGSFFTDRAVLIDGSGAHAAGRAAIRELLEGLPERRDLLLQITGARGGTRLIHAVGRASYFEGEDLRVESFVALLELHRDRWMFRMLAFAPLDGLLAAAPLDYALAPNRASVHPPQRTMVRGVVEPSLMHQPGVAGGSEWQAFGGAVGVELDRTAELRAFAWAGGGGEASTTVAYGAEVRAFMLRAARIRPNLMAGAAMLPGVGSAGARWDGLAGAGVGIRLRPGTELHVSGRSLPATWFSDSRSMRVLLGVGLSYAFGRPPVWQDAELSVLDQAYEMTELPGFTPSVVAWATAMSRREREALEARYASTVTLYGPDGVRRGAPDVVASWLDAERPVDMVIDAQRVSGSVAYAEFGVTDNRAGWRVLNVYEREDAGWRIHSQVVW